jgi:hypothetical protein
MIPFPMVMGDELGDDLPQMALAEQNDPVETLGLDRQDEPLREGVQVRASGGQPQHRHPALLKRFSKVAG